MHHTYTQNKSYEMTNYSMLLFAIAMPQLLKIIRKRNKILFNIKNIFLFYDFKVATKRKNIKAIPTDYRTKINTERCKLTLQFLYNNHTYIRSIK